MVTEGARYVGEDSPVLTRFDESGFACLDIDVLNRHGGRTKLITSS